MSSYTSEAEIDLARNRSLQTINNVVQSTLAYSEQLTKRKVDVEAKKVELQGKPVVAVLDRELESIDAELARQAELIVQKKQEDAAIIAKYDADKQRWRELVAAKDKPAKLQATPAKTAEARPPSPSRARPRSSGDRAHGGGGLERRPIHFPERTRRIPGAAHRGLR